MSLGSIVVRLSLQTADFETDAGRAAKVAEKRAKEIDAAFRKAGVAIGAALGAAAVAVGAAVKKSIDHMDEMSKAAQKVGQSTEEFSKLVYAGSLADVSMDQLVTTMGRLTNAQAAALDSGSQQAKIFDALSISVKNADGSLRSSSDVLLDFADRFKELKGSPEAMAAGFAIFGKSFQDIIPLIKDGADGLREAYGEAERFGKVIDSEAAVAAEKFNDDLTRLQAQIEGAALEVAQGLLPALDSLITSLNSPDAQAGFARIVGGLGDIASAAVKAMEWLIKFDGQLSQTLGNGTRKGNAFDFFQGIEDYGKRIVAGDTRGANAAAARARAGLRGTGIADFGSVTGGSAGGADFSMVTGGSRGGGSANTAALRRMLAGAGGGGSRKPRGGGRVDGAAREAARAAEEAARKAREAEEAQIRWHDSILDMEATLRGPLFEAQREFDKNMQRLNADFNDGKVKLADYAKALDAYGESYRRERAEIEARKSPAQELIASLKEEVLLIGMGDAAREKYIARQRAGKDATIEEIKELEKLIDIQRQAAAAADLQHAVQRDLADMFRGLATDAGNAKEIVKGFFDNLAGYITQMIAENWAKKIGDIFSGASANGGAGGGTNWFDWAVKLFGGARAGGGPVDPNRAYLVGERGPELIVPRTAGLVLNTHQTSAALAGAGGGISQVNQFHFAAPTDPRTQVQMAARVAFETKRATRRNG